MAAHFGLKLGILQTKLMNKHFLSLEINQSFILNYSKSGNTPKTSQPGL